MSSELPLSQIRDWLGCPSLHIDVRSNWASTTPNHRALIREALSFQTGADHSDVQTLPQHANYSISIAHCPSLGGYALAEEPIGLDLEKLGRATTRLVNRIAKPEDLAQAPSSDHLWCAMEAAYKALRGPLQPTTLSGVRVSSWEPVEGISELERIWRFEGFFASGQCLRFGHGVVIPREAALIAVFRLNPST